MPTTKKTPPPALDGKVVAGDGACPEGEAQGRRLSGGAFARLRSSLGKSQRELAELLGLSLKAIESYEQGWRRVPAHVERVLYFLLFKLNEDAIEAEDPCWQSTACPDEQRDKCVAYVAREGSYCWFFTGRLCGATKGSASGAARDAKGLDKAGDGGCYTCSVFTKMLAKIEGGKS
jgi:hypothetical protein